MERDDLHKIIDEVVPVLDKQRRLIEQLLAAIRRECRKNKSDLERFNNARTVNREYNLSQSESFSSFISSIKLDSIIGTPVAMVYNEYCNYCDDISVKPISNDRFGKLMHLNHGLKSSNKRFSDKDLKALGISSKCNVLKVYVRETPDGETVTQ